MFIYFIFILVVYATTSKGGTNNHPFVVRREGDGPRGRWGGLQGGYGRPRAGQLGGPASRGLVTFMLFGLRDATILGSLIMHYHAVSPY
eukprot:1185630-Prorocentrum_minimum.AAC.3